MLPIGYRICVLGCACSLILALVAGCGNGKPVDSGKAKKKSGNAKQSNSAKSKSTDNADDDSSLGDLIRKKLEQAETSETQRVPPRKEPDPVILAAKPMPVEPQITKNSPEHPVPGKLIADVQRSVYQSLWTRDGRRLVVIASGQLMVVDVATGAIQNPGPDNAYQLALSPDEQTLAITTEDHRIEFWNFPDVGSGPVAQTPAQKDLIPQIKFSPDSNTLYSTTYNATKVQAWNRADGKLAKELPVEKLQIQYMELSNDGNLLALTGEFKVGEFQVVRQLQIWDLKTNQIRHELPIDYMATVMAFTSQGKQLAVGAFIPSSVWLWDTDSGKLIKELTGHGGEIKALAYIDHDQYLVSGSSDKTIRVWDSKTGAQKAVLEGPKDTIRSLVAAPKVPWFASADGREIRFWSIEDVLNHPERSTKTGGELRSVRAHEDGGLWHFDVSKDGKYLVSRNSETVKLWNIESAKMIKSFPSQESGAPPVAISPDGKQFAFTKYQAIDLYSIPGGELQQTLKHEEIYRSRRLIYTPDGNKLIVGTGKFVQVWDVATNRLLKDWEPDTTGIESMAITSDSQRLITGNESGKLTFWNLSTYKSLKSIQVSQEQIMEIALSSDDAVMATSSFNEPLRIWDVATETIRLTKNLHAARIDGMVFLPGTSFLAVPGVEDQYALQDEYRNAVTILDTKTGESVKVLKGHTETVMTLRYLPERKQLVTSDQYSIKFWELDPAELHPMTKSQ